MNNSIFISGIQHFFSCDENFWNMLLATLNMEYSIKTIAIMLCMTSPALIYLLTPWYISPSSTPLPLATNSFVLFISSGGDCYPCVSEDTVSSHRLRAQYHKTAPSPPRYQWNIVGLQVATTAVGFCSKCDVPSYSSLNLHRSQKTLAYTDINFAMKYSDIVKLNIFENLYIKWQFNSFSCYLLKESWLSGNRKFWTNMLNKIRP